MGGQALILFMLGAMSFDEKLKIELSFQEAYILRSFLLQAKFSDKPRPEIFLNPLINRFIKQIDGYLSLSDDFRIISEYPSLSEDGVSKVPAFAEIENYVSENHSGANFDDLLREALFPFGEG